MQTIADETIQLTLGYQFSMKSSDVYKLLYENTHTKIFQVVKLRKHCDFQNYVSKW